ncbi:ArsR/SmtB family transcription factor [Salinisphaera hydrothermalis]|uniref:ArsR family transcriptional regulator n=1 Tax=Salinisphaera hydrothermalis (strain C41B8) TaxID=1304275 RepID=A0A084IHG8_SALHC|nr:helix-turn-helix domain-containing protein [Salinisphaera hydrothermalis]KEZ76152.1 ArsR family transcriptional regulator [Salinisphaera hydrothermalis C41B8]
MRPLTHPSTDDVSLEAILHALSDPVRMAIYAELEHADGPQSCTRFATALERGIPKSTLSQHFRVLREAGLVHSERQGVEMRNTSRRADIDRRFPGLLDAIMSAYRQQMGERSTPAS